MFSFTDTFLQGQGDAADNPPANPFFSPFGHDDYPELLRAIRLLPTDAINAPTIPSSSSPLPEPPDHDKGTAAQELPKVMASSAGGGRRPARKDRHSKIVTAKGPRDRRMRLSLDVAKKFFDLQDALHFDKPSETVEWLLNKSKYAIRSLGSRSRSDQEGSSCNDANTEPPTSSSECGEVDSQTMIGKDASRTIDEIDPGPVVGIEEQTNEGAQNLPKARWQTPRKTMLLHPTSIAKESRAKARARARERTMEKKILKQLGSPTGSSSDMQKMNSSQLGALDYFQ